MVTRGLAVRQGADRDERTAPIFMTPATPTHRGNLIFPLPLAGEGRGEGDSFRLPLSSILPRRGEEEEEALFTQPEIALIVLSRELCYE
jgi:hypothetical protein